MARRPSTVSLSSVGSGTSLSKLAQLPPLPSVISRSSSKSLANGSPLAGRQVSVAQLDVGKDGATWDPDELFTKHNVAEVRVIQQRLRADADAKQEELRLMVGERYRDLLQASTSIISLAKSSDHVVHSLGEMRNITSSIQTVDSPKLSGPGQGDVHLQSLQSLAAHLKLLLDSPEHLWRLMERRLYLQAAWLFLLSRVVHRSLLRHEEDDDEDNDWATLGMDITEQFPLVQRQWEAISQFRSQIAHKATLSLRESNLTSPEVCAILLALHLLESRPFAETLNTFLAQRTRCLTTALARSKDRLPNGNGSAAELSLAHTVASDGRSRKIVIRDMRHRLKTVLEIVCKTLGSSRDVFLGGSEKPPLMRQVLAHIQAPVPSSSDDLPSEVRLTSQALLSSLPSSNHFLLLPSTVKSYKPYVDVDSLSSQKEARFAKSLEGWFATSMETVRSAMTSWFAELNTIRELWEMRAWCRQWLQTTQGAQREEKAALHACIDEICRLRAVEIWKSVLSSIDAAFREHLDSALSELKQTSRQHSLDAEPIRYLLQAPPISLAAPSGLNASIPFQKYSGSLQQQIAGRTPLLQDVLNTVESRVQALRDDLDTMRGQDEDTQNLASKLLEDYRADADSMCKSVCSNLRAASDNLGEMSDSTLRPIVFVGRLADDLASSARLLTSIGCSPPATDDFRDRLKAIYDSVIQQWRDYVVQQTIETYRRTFDAIIGVDKSLHVPDHGSSRPSTAIVNSVLSLSTCIQQLGSLLDPSRASERAKSLLVTFAAQLVRQVDADPQLKEKHGVEVARDLTFVQVLVAAWGEDTKATQDRLHEVSAQMVGKLADLTGIHAGMVEAVAKMQLLFGVLLPSSPTSAPGKKLHETKPASSVESALELVKPSARFGLLLVGSSLAR